MQNIRIGVVVSSVPVAVKWSSPAPCPLWITHTMAPKVADTLSRLRMTALVGTSRLPNVRHRVTNVTRAMIPRAHGTREKIAAFESTRCADDPVTSTGHGEATARTRWTRCSPAGDWGCSDATGTTDSHVPVGLANRAVVAGDAGATCAPPTNDPVSASTRATVGTRDRADAYDEICESPPPAGATTERALASPERKLAVRLSLAARVLAEAGSTRASGWPKCTPVNGMPSTSSRATMAAAIGSGR